MKSILSYLFHKRRNVWVIHTIRSQVNLEVDCGGCYERQSHGWVSQGEIREPVQSSSLHGLHWSVGHASEAKEHGGEEDTLGHDWQHRLDGMTVLG